MSMLSVLVAKISLEALVFLSVSCYNRVMLKSFRVWFSLWWPVILLYGGITYLSDQSKLPGPSGEAVEFVWFKLGHLVIYGALGWLVCRAVVLSQTQKKKRVNRDVWIKVLCIVAVLASIDELHQYFVPGRGPHIRDVGIDIIGASLGVLWWQARYNLDVAKLRLRKSSVSSNV